MSLWIEKTVLQAGNRRKTITVGQYEDESRLGILRPSIRMFPGTGAMICVMRGRIRTSRYTCIGGMHTDGRME